MKTLSGKEWGIEYRRKNQKGEGGQEEGREEKPFLPPGQKKQR